MRFIVTESLAIAAPNQGQGLTQEHRLQSLTLFQEAVKTNQFIDINLTIRSHSGDCFFSQLRNVLCLCEKIHESDTDCLKEEQIS